MPLYVSLMKFTEQGIKNIKDAPKRLQEGIKGLEALGGKLIGFYLVMGEYRLRRYCRSSQRRGRCNLHAWLGRRRERQDHNDEGFHHGTVFSNSRQAALTGASRRQIDAL